MKKGKLGDTIHISTNKFISIKNICRKIYKILKGKNKFIFTKDRIGKDFAYRLSSQKLRKNFNWIEKNNLEYNLKITCDWYSKNFDKLKKINLKYEHKK